MKHAVIGLGLFVAGAAAGAWLAGARPANAATESAPKAADMAAAEAPKRYALQAWEGCRPLEAGDAFTGNTTRTLALADGREVQVALVPVTRANGALVLDALVKQDAISTRTQIGFQSPLLTDGVLMRAVDLDAVRREVSGDAPHLYGPHPMAQ